MKSDLDRLMQENNLEAMLITGPAQHNPPMAYLTGPVHLTNADLLKKRGAEPILFYNPMERDEAAKSGFPTKNLADYRLNDLLKKTDGDMLQATILRYQKMLDEHDVSSGRIDIYGKMDAGAAYSIFSGLQEKLPNLEFVSQLGDSIILKAMATKDTDEIERIRHMGNVTTNVVGKVADYLTSHKSKDDYLIKPVKSGVLAAHLKKLIRRNNRAQTSIKTH